MTKKEIAQEALARARNNNALSNYPTIYEGFVSKGIAESDILPRENVFTYHAWQALGRQVKKGEHGVKVCTWVDMTKYETDEDTGKIEAKNFRRPRMTTVFHVSQTDLIKQ